MKRCYGNYNPKLLFKMIAHLTPTMDQVESIKEKKKVFYGQKEPKTPKEKEIKHLKEVFWYLKKRKFTKQVVLNTYHLLTNKNCDTTMRNHLHVLIHDVIPKESDMFETILNIIRYLAKENVFYHDTQTMCGLICNKVLLMRKYHPVIFYYRTTKKIISQVELDVPEVFSRLQLQKLIHHTKKFNQQQAIKETGEIIETLRIFQNEIKEIWKIQELYLAGSYARGEQNEYSDIDLYITKHQYNTYDMNQYFTKLLNHSVDMIVVEEEMKNQLNIDIITEKIKIFGKEEKENEI